MGDWEKLGKEFGLDSTDPEMTEKLLSRFGTSNTKNVADINPINNSGSSKSYYRFAVRFLHRFSIWVTRLTWLLIKFIVISLLVRSAIRLIRWVWNKIFWR